MYFFEMYLTCVSSKLCEFIQQGKNSKLSKSQLTVGEIGRANADDDYGDFYEGADNSAH